MVEQECVATHFHGYGCQRCQGCLGCHGHNLGVHGCRGHHSGFHTFHGCLSHPSSCFYSKPVVHPMYCRMSGFHPCCHGLYGLHDNACHSHESDCHHRPPLCHGLHCCGRVQSERNAAEDSEAVFPSYLKQTCPTCRVSPCGRLSPCGCLCTHCRHECTTNPAKDQSLAGGEKEDEKIKHGITGCDVGKLKLGSSERIIFDDEVGNYEKESA